MRMDDRKAAIAAYKERKTLPGIYALRCAATAECWVGAAPDLATIQNRLWFGLRLGTFHGAGLQSAYDAHGASGLTYEVLEQLEEESDPYLRGSRLKERLAHWRGALNAGTI